MQAAPSRDGTLITAQLTAVMDMKADSATAPALLYAKIQTALWQVDIHITALPIAAMPMRAVFVTVPASRCA